jgi:hypothetical protein
MSGRLAGALRATADAYRIEPTMIGRPLADRLPPGIRLELVSIDAAEHWSAGPDSSRTISVHGPRWALANWLAGRFDPVRPARS